MSKPTSPGEDAREERVCARARRATSRREAARCVAARRPAGASSKTRAVERVGEQGDQAARGPHRQAGCRCRRVMTKRIPWRPRGRPTWTRVARVLVAAEQPIELVELPPLALPPHEASFGSVPAAARDAAGGTGRAARRSRGARSARVRPDARFASSPVNGGVSRGPRRRSTRRTRDSQRGSAR